MVVDGLDWLVQDRIDKGRLKGATFGNREQVCNEMFANDTNALVEYDDKSIEQFWECLQIYYQASRFVINHYNIAMRESI